MRDRASSTLKSYLDYPDLIEVEPCDDYCLKAKFATGETKIVDIKPYFQWKVFQPLQDVELFNKAHAEYGGVVWNDKIDLAQEALYDKGVLVDE